MSNGPTTRKRLLITLTLAVAALVSYVAWQHTRLKEYQIIKSPDERFQLVVYRRSTWFSMPGQAGDARGVVRLFDRSGRLLYEANIPMVQQVNDLQWTHDRVSIPLVFDWNLPE